MVGKVWATSREGIGTIIVLCFEKISGGTYEMSKILIIEDEEAIADLEKDYLELSGFEVEIANRGDVALKKHSMKIMILLSWI